MAKCRIGHFAGAQDLRAYEIDYIDESEVLTPADLEHHVDKWQFTIPFVCGCTNLGEALRRIAEARGHDHRKKGEASTGDIVNENAHGPSVFGGIRRLQSLQTASCLPRRGTCRRRTAWCGVREGSRLPVVTFTAGGIATPADASLCMQLGADGVFVGSGIFKSGNPSQRARAIVEATTHYMDADVLARVSANLGEAMVGISTQSLDPSDLLERRGWYRLSCWSPAAAGTSGASSFGARPRSAGTFERRGGGGRRAATPNGCRPTFVTPSVRRFPC